MTTETETPNANLRIRGDRLWQSLMEMAEIGPGIAGGNNRQALTDEDGEGRALFKRWCEEEGMTVSVDRVGNMFARREGSDPDLPPVCLGSHLDTQPTGGRYDGVLGVLAALEVARSLNEHGITTRHPLVLVNWTNEEGTRFAPPIMGSSAYIGRYTAEELYDSRDAAGLRLGDELERIGWRGEEPIGQQPMHCYFELHIEQGPILEAEGKDIGVVTHGQGNRWIEGRITGRESHTGSTPMTMRRDAMRGLARMIDLAHAIAMEHAPNAVGTVAHAELTPNSRNVIAGQVVFTADLRSHDPDILHQMEADFTRRAAEACAALELDFSSQIVGTYEPPQFDETCVAAIRDAATTLNYDWRDIVSGAGHDASLLNTVVPSAMIMCPCVDGLSHNEAEEITPAWAEAGANVLLHAALARAGIGAQA